MKLCPHCRRPAWLQIFPYRDPGSRRREYEVEYWCDFCFWEQRLRMPEEAFEAEETEALVRPPEP